MLGYGRIPAIYDSFIYFFSDLKREEAAWSVFFQLQSLKEVNKEKRSGLVDSGLVVGI